MDSSIIVPGKSSKVAAGALLDTWAGHDWRDGVLVDRLLIHDRLSVRTKHNHYEFIVTDPQAATVMVRGGAYFPEFTQVRVAGCSLGGSFLKVHGIYVGFRIELLSDSQVIMTSPVETLSLKRDQSKPRLM